MLGKVAASTLRKRRSVAVLLISLLVMVLQSLPFFQKQSDVTPAQTDVLSDTAEGSELASDVLERLLVKGRAPKTGYARDQFSDGWALVGGCDVRNIILKRSLTELKLADDGCVVMSGILDDPYTGEVINFVRGSSTSDAIQIDHVVALSDAWQKGAQNVSADERLRLANDPLNLLAVDGPANQEKGDADSASWLPPNKSFRCAYVARQVAVKSKYSLWVTEAEKSAMKRVLNGCGEQRVPIEK
ncbi:HNH endonuclease [Candidatus Saccharibacteria bacterium]|nr:HNH endonuclease [Candidatus Saccharibacteria bacterium]MCA9328479.1 HNH endonuclease [Candidatus Saccharibacteria bacterium]